MFPVGYGVNPSIKRAMESGEAADLKRAEEKGKAGDPRGMGKAR